jgi:hypothetical protein
MGSILFRTSTTIAAARAPAPTAAGWANERRRTGAGDPRGWVVTDPTFAERSVEERSDEAIPTATATVASLPRDDG